MRISDWSSDVCSSDLSAAYILRYADIVGIGYVTTIDNAERKQQIFEPVVLAKGEGSRFELIPTRIGRVGTQTDAYGPIQAENGDLAFAALRKVDGGYVFSECIAATWHVKRKGPLLRAIDRQRTRLNSIHSCASLM